MLQLREFEVFFPGALADFEEVAALLPRRAGETTPLGARMNNTRKPDPWWPVFTPPGVGRSYFVDDLLECFLGRVAASSVFSQVRRATVRAAGLSPATPNAS